MELRSFDGLAIGSVQLLRYTIIIKHTQRCKYKTFAFNFTELFD